MVGIKDLKKLYEKEDRFRRYVDRTAANYGLTMNEVLSQALTREVARSYMDEGSGSALASGYMPMGECV